MVRSSVSSLVRRVIDSLASAGALPGTVLNVPVQIDSPKAGDHGDFTTNFALVASKTAGIAPREIAATLQAALASDPRCNEAFESVEVAGPGFINFRLRPAWVAHHLVSIRDQGERFGTSQSEEPLSINVEFVSVNPNGPITIGSGRGAAFGSALCNVLEAVGHTVCREYYINDGVNSEQMRLFAESVKAIIEGKPVPENGYKGDYVEDVAHTLMDHDLLRKASTEAEAVRSLALPEPGALGQFHHGHAKDNIGLWQARVDLLSDLEKQVQQDKKAFLKLSLTGQIEVCSALMVVSQHNDLKAFGTEFNIWFSEQSLHDSEAVKEAIDHLVDIKVADTGPYQTEVVRAKGGVVTDVIKKDQPDDDDAEGTHQTLWLRSTKFGDEKDRVLRRKDGRLTYIASDVAYHKDKFSRPVSLRRTSADKLVTVLGPDHHGYIGRLQAVVAALHADHAKPLADDSPLTEHEESLFVSVPERNQCRASLEWAKDHLDVLIFQLVRFLKDGQPAPMRKRDGNIYALIDLITEIGEQVRPEGTQEEKLQAGSDVARFFYLMRHHETTMDFDLELATRQSDENPVFYVQYAHARICSVLDKAKEAGIDPGSGANEPDTGLLVHDKERALILKIAEFPGEVARTAEDLSVNRIATYSLELARTYHAFYDNCRVVQPDQPGLSAARVALCTAARDTLAAGLRLLGVSAPVRM